MTPDDRGVGRPGGITQLGYLAFEVSDLAAWEAFATGVLGLGVARRWDGGMSLRLDRHAERIYLSSGPADDLVAIGWQAADEAAVDAVAARLAAAGYDVHEADPGPRQVARLRALRDPFGIRTELYCGPRLAAPFVSPIVGSGFVADDHGLGHLVVSAADEAATSAFYRDLLGFRLSDRITCEFHGHAVDLTFLHTNQRHHSLAFGGPQAKRLHHFLIEVGSLDDVGLAMDRALAAGVRVMQTLGRHPNDRMISFYALTPSGFQFEYGCGGRLIEDDAAWTPVVHDRISEWGHHPPALLRGKR
jgi:2,3-dihydroxybiphenyl 1,2-dioxygenase